MFRSAGGVLTCVLVAACGPSSESTVDQVTGPVLPTEANDWMATGDEEFFDTESIYAYIDGHAEVYLAYGMKRCVSRRYLSPNGDVEIVVDLFEMASPSDAYGVFSHDRAGEEVAVGGGGIFRHGWLSFWKGSWYGSVYASGGDEGARQAVLDVGRTIAGAVEGEGAVPALVGRMPTSGLDPASVCFLTSPQILNAHIFVGGDNPFGLEPGAEAVVGKYDLGGAAATLVLVQFPDETAAETVEKRLGEGEPDGESRPLMVVGRHGVYVAAVVGAEMNDSAETLLETALGGGA